MKLNSTKRRKSPRLFKGKRDKRNFLQFVQSTTGSQLQDLTDYYEAYAFKLIMNEGKLSAAKRLKEIYNVALRYSANLSFDPIPFLRSNKRGLPRVLNPFDKLLTGSPSSIRAALSVLQLYKLIEAKGPADLKSIEQPYTGNPKPNWLPVFREVVLESFPTSEISERIPKESSLFISGKNGPNGPAMSTLHIDYKSMHGSSLLANITELATLLGNETLLELINETATVCDVEVKNADKIPTHSRLRIKSEAGGKSRIFCILDYFTQSCLEPIHNYFMDWLKKKACDGTNNHSDAAHAVRRWTRTNKPIWSFDLTTATDRYPVFIQEIVVTAAFGPEISRLWKEIITNREFVTPEGDRSVRFAVGQPLGALSSWAVFAATHHFHIQTAARLCGYEVPFQQYRMIGDDISIHQDAAIAAKYIEMMSDLGVPFSKPKSITPSQCKKHNVAELAKRLFCNGVELTPVPPDAIIEMMRDPFGKRILFETAWDRGYMQMGNPYTVQSLLSKDSEWACLTFPVGKTLPLVKEVKDILSNWDVDSGEDPPFDLSRGWLYWYTRPFDLDTEDNFFFEEILRDYLTQEVSSAIGRNASNMQRLYDIEFESDNSNQGGGWKPSLWELPNSYNLIISATTASYMKFLQAMYRRGKSADKADPYRLIALVHSMVESTVILGRSQDFRDEKTKTRVFVSRVIRGAIKVGNTGIYPIDTLPYGFRTIKEKLFS